jgi:hypothetical protein
MNTSTASLGPSIYLWTTLQLDLNSHVKETTVCSITPKADRQPMKFGGLRVVNSSSTAWDKNIVNSAVQKQTGNPLISDLPQTFNLVEPGFDLVPSQNAWDANF